MAWLKNHLAAWLVIAAVSTVAFLLSFFLSADLTPKLSPLTVFEPGVSYWVSYDTESPIWDIWFDGDPQMILANLTQADRAHFSLYKHPIFAIAFYPIVWLLVTLTSDIYLGVRLFFAANAFLSTALLGALVYRLRLNLIDVALCSLVFVVSSTMLFWYTIPEKFPLGATIFLIALHVAMSAAPKTLGGYVAHTAVSVATLAVTLTNWAVGLLTTAAVFGVFDRPLALLARWRKDWRKIWPDLKLPILITLAAFVVTSVIALIQNMLFGEASLFFVVTHYLKEGDYALEYFLTPAWMRPVSLFTSGVVMGTLETWHFGARLTADNITPSTWAGWIAMTLWCLLLLRGIAVSVRHISGAESTYETLVRRMLIVTFATLAFFMVLHSVYGYIAFLYIAHVTPFVLVLLAMNFNNTDTKFLGVDNIVVLRVMLVLLVVTAALNNFELLQQASSFVDERISSGMRQAPLR